VLATPAGAPEGARQEGERRGGRRRRRGRGGDRSERGERAQRPGGEGERIETPAATLGAIGAESMVEESVARAEYAPPAPEVVQVAEERAAPAPAPEPVQSFMPEMPAEREAPVVIAPAEAVPQPAPAATAVPAPQPNLDEVLKESGLVMIETQAGKAKSVDAPSGEEESPVERPRRERRPPPPDLNQPLEQVETHKEEDQPSA
jgi:ribonuclease E